MATQSSTAYRMHHAQIERNRGANLRIQIVIAVILGILLAGGVFVADRLPSLFVIGYFGLLIGGLIGLVVGDVRRWLVGFTVLDASIVLDAYPGYSEQAVVLGSISGYVISITTLILPVLYGMWAVELLVTKRKPARRPLLRAMGPLAVYFVGIGLSWTNATNTTFVSFEVFMLIQCLLLMIYMAGGLRTRADIVFLMPFIAVSLAIQCIVMTIQRVGYVNPAIVWFEFSASARPVGVFGSANVAGGYLGVVLIPLFSLLFVKDVPRFWKVALLPVLAWALICLVWTQSRGAWLAFAASAGIFLTASWRRRWISSRLFFAILTTTTIFLAALSPLILERLTGDDAGAAEARGPLNEIAIAMFNGQILTGIGANNFALELPNYVPPRLSSEWLFIVHNKYLLVLSETGIIGFAGWFGFLLVTIWRGIKLWRLRDLTLSMIGLGILAALLGHYSHMLGEIFNARPMVQFLWCYSAILFAMIRIVEEERSPKADLPPYLQDRTWRPFGRLGLD